MGEPLEIVSTRRLHAIVGRTDRSVRPDRQTLSAQDRLIVELSQRTTAILPARFGSTLPDDATVVARLNELEPELSKALAEVRGREQMVLRVFRGVQKRSQRFKGVHKGSQGFKGDHKGTAYMIDRARRAREPVPELRSVLPAVESLVEAERVVRHDIAPLVATVYHLVERGRAEEYAAAVRAAAIHARGLRLTISGPFAPYAFAPDPCR